MGNEYTNSRFSYQSLLLCMVTLYALIPISHEVEAAQRYINIGFTMLLIASVYSVATKTSRVIIAICLAIPALAGRWLTIDNLPLDPHLIQFSFTVLLHIYVTIIIMKHIFKATVVSTDVLFGAVCVYFMLGFIWGSGYALIELLEPGSFKGLPEYAQHFPAEQKIDVQWHHLIYFSFITLTTLGYGHVAPLTVTANSMTSLEAITGQLYLTILVARMVALYVTQGQKQEEKRLSSHIERKLEKKLTAKETPSKPPTGPKS